MRKKQWDAGLPTQDGRTAIWIRRFALTCRTVQVFARPSATFVSRDIGLSAPSTLGARTDRAPDEQPSPYPRYHVGSTRIPPMNSLPCPATCLPRGHVTARVFCLLLAVLFCVVFRPSASAQAATGTIRGSVSNGSTQLFLDRAEVKIDGTKFVALTERDGTYELRDLPPGSYNLSVSYTGLDTEKRAVTVAAGSIAKQDFSLTADVYKLGAFTVAAEAEGNAAEINKQKKADFFMESVSADSLGTVPDGNIGEFLRYMPGIQINYSNADANTVSMRGQDPDATVVTFDGQIPRPQARPRGPAPVPAMPPAAPSNSARLRSTTSRASRFTKPRRRGWRPRPAA